MLRSESRQSDLTYTVFDYRWVGDSAIERFDEIVLWWPQPWWRPSAGCLTQHCPRVHKLQGVDTRGTQTCWPWRRGPSVNHGTRLPIRWLHLDEPKSSYVQLFTSAKHAIQISWPPWLELECECIEHQTDNAVTLLGGGLALRIDADVRSREAPSTFCPRHKSATKFCLLADKLALRMHAMIAYDASITGQ